MAYGLACAVVGDPSDAEHVVTEAYAQIWRTADTFVFARGSLGTWIATIVLTRAMDVWRGRHWRESLFATDFATDVPMHE